MRGYLRIIPPMLTEILLKLKLATRNPSSLKHIDGNLGIKRCYRDTQNTMTLGRHFQQYFSYIVEVSFAGGGNRRTRRKPPFQPVASHLIILKQTMVF